MGVSCPHADVAETRRGGAAAVRLETHVLGAETAAFEVRIAAAAEIA